MQRSIESFENSAWQRVGSFIIQDRELSRIVSMAKIQYSLDFLGKNILITQALKRFSPEDASGKRLMSNEVKPSRIPRTGKRSSRRSSTTRAGGTNGGWDGSESKGGRELSVVCFLCGNPGHIITKCDVIDQTDDWIEIPELPEMVRDVASAVRGSMRSD